MRSIDCHAKAGKSISIQHRESWTEKKNTGTEELWRITAYFEQICCQRLSSEVVVIDSAPSPFFVSILTRVP